MEKEITKQDLVFVYSRSVVKALKDEGIPYICSAIAHGSGMKFWLYPRSKRVEKVMAGCKKIN